MAQNRTLYSLEAGRGVAALAVVVHHASLSTAAYIGALPANLSAIVIRGYLGVDFFFVLSGFIIYYTNHGRTPDWAWAANFGESRLIRIFVPYLPAGIGLALLYLALPALSSADRPWSWFASATLLPSPSPTALSVAWTLRHELIFYALFLVVYRLGRPLTICGVWAGICVAYRVAFGDASLSLSFPLALINIEFFAGMLAAHAVISSRSDGWPLWLCLGGGGAAYMAIFLSLGAPREWSIFFGLALACWIVPLVRAELSGRLIVPESMAFLGAASYSIYLVHDPLVALVVRSVRRVDVLHNWAVALPVLVIAGTLGGIAYHLGWERPLLAYIKNRRRRSKLAREERIGGAGAQIG